MCHLVLGCKKKSCFKMNSSRVFFHSFNAKALPRILTGTFLENKGFHFFTLDALS